MHLKLGPNLFFPSIEILDPEKTFFVCLDPSFSYLLQCLIKSGLLNPKVEFLICYGKF